MLDESEALEPKAQEMCGLEVTRCDACLIS
jgi:hypothetical protein